jgi:hypothetical protein
LSITWSGQVRFANFTGLKARYFSMGICFIALSPMVPLGHRADAVTTPALSLYDLRRIACARHFDKTS